LRSQSWFVDSDGNNHFQVISNGLTPRQWEDCFDSLGIHISPRARNVLRLVTEAPTTGVAHQIVVRPASRVSKRNRSEKKIRSAAKEMGWRELHWECACLMRAALTDEKLEAMGLWSIVAMMNPTRDSKGYLRLLSLGRYGCGNWLGADLSHPVHTRDITGGFAFSETRVSPQT
jgi:hypothetical protein